MKVKAELFMKNVIIYTKKYELKFDKNGISKIDTSDLIEDLSENYIILDSAPTITIAGDSQYVSLKLVKKETGKKIGF